LTTLMVDLAATTADSSGNVTAWFALGGALGGVLLTGVIGLATAILTHRWQAQATSQQILDEHAVRLRQERRESYATYWSAWNRLAYELRELLGQVALVPGDQTITAQRWTIDDLQLRDEAQRDALVEANARVLDAELGWQAATGSLLLIAGPEVVEAAEQHQRATRDKINDARKGLYQSVAEASQQLNAAMRAEIIMAPLAESGESFGVGKPRLRRVSWTRKIK
jgi:hypothetical protein